MTCGVETCLHLARVHCIVDDIGGSKWNSFAKTQISLHQSRRPTTTTMMMCHSRPSIRRAAVAEPAQHVAGALPVNRLPVPMSQLPVPTASADGNDDDKQKADAADYQGHRLHKIVRTCTRNQLHFVTFYISTLEILLLTYLLTYLIMHRTIRLTAL